MSTNRVDRLHLAVLDGHLMDDATLARLVPECRSLTAFTTDASQLGLAQRWTAIAPEIDFFDGGHVANLREALVECAKRRIVVISTGVPKDPATFVALALQGAAAMTEFEIPGVAVHVMRPVEQPGTVAWLTDTGELSGYGVLFAVGYAHLHGTGLDLIEPTGGLDKPRTGEALDDALAFAEAAGVPITRHTDPSPFARVLRDEHCLVVHPVLDAPKGFNLLHPGELSHKAVASGNPAVVVDLLEQFPGDVVAVFDGVHLLSGSIPAARIAAGVALGVVAAAGIGTMVASPAMAAEQSVSQAAAAPMVQVQVTGKSTVAVTNPSTVPLHVTAHLTGQHGHNGSIYDAGTRDLGTIPPGAVGFTIHLPDFAHDMGHNLVGVRITVTGGSGQINLVIPGGGTTVTPGGNLTVAVPTNLLPQISTSTPDKGPEPIVITGTPGPTFEEKSPVVVPEIVPNPVVVVEGYGPVPVPTLPPQQTPPPITQETPTPMAVPTLKPTLEPPVIQQTPPPITQETPTPMAVPTLKPTLEPPVIQQTPPPITQETPTPMAVPTLKPTLEPPVIQQTPPPITQETPTPMAVPTLKPTLEPPPLQATPTVVTTESVPTVAVTTDVPVDVGGSVVTPGVTSEVPTGTTSETVTSVVPGTTSTTTPAETGVTTPSGHGPTSHVTQHHTTPTGQLGGPSAGEHQAPEGELAHTGGNTAILAIVAGSLLAAGAGLAVAGRMGKDDPDIGVTEG